MKHVEQIHAVIERSEPIPHIRLHGVSKQFQHGKQVLPVLEEINFDVTPGEFLSLVGPSGCGKSTILNLIAGLNRPDAGDVLVNGEPVSRPGPDRLLLFQEPALFPWLDVLSNIEFGLSAIGTPARERREVALKYLQMVHLGNFAGYRVHQLSGGMRQRLALARALAIDPAILLMDEPFTALDAQTGDILRAELQQIWAKTQKTILFVTHNVREAVMLGDRVLVFTHRPGRVKLIFNTAHLARPRSSESAGVQELVREITAVLKQEVHQAVEDEYGEAFLDYSI